MPEAPDGVDPIEFLRRALAISPEDAKRVRDATTEAAQQKRESATYEAAAEAQAESVDWSGRDAHPYTAEQ